MNKKKAQSKIREIKKAMNAFPAVVRNQERIYLEEQKILKAFGKISLKLKPLGRKAN